MKSESCSEIPPSLSSDSSSYIWLFQPHLTDNEQAGCNRKTLAFRATKKTTTEKAAGMEKLYQKVYLAMCLSAMCPKARVLSGFDKALLTIQCFLVKAGRLNCVLPPCHVSAPGSLIKNVLSLVFLKHSNFQCVRFRACWQ